MSSVPFSLGVPVVDSLPNSDGTYILRSKSHKDAIQEIGRLRQNLTTKDRISAYWIGNRPDKPIPVSRYFVEVRVEIGTADDWMAFLPNVSLYNYVTTGVIEESEG
jgi:hypothetical protein